MGFGVSFMFVVVVKGNVVIFSMDSVVMVEKKIVLNEGVVIFYVFEGMFFGIC